VSTGGGVAAGGTAGDAELLLLPPRPRGAEQAFESLHSGRRDTAASGAAEHDVLVATGHLDGEEVARLKVAAAATGVARFLI
jgi:hypothetical protein